MSRTRAVIAALALAGACREVPDDQLPAAATTAAPPVAARIVYPRPGSFVDLIAAARHGVVAIKATTPVKSGPAAMYPGAPESAADVALGTGFLVEAKGVYVLTNDHIAAAAPDLRVVLADGSELPATVRGRDTKLDLALLALDPSAAAAAHLVALPLGDSAGLQVGESVVALGDAFGDGVTASVGIVSSTGHDASGSIVVGGALGFRTYIETDARVTRGNSGGPLIDTAGQVVGVAVATSDRPGELSFAIPIDRAREVIGALRDRGSVARSWLGMRVLPVPPELAMVLALPAKHGPLVTELIPGTPAAASALRPGDVIMSWGDREVDEHTLPAAVAATPPGTAVTVTIWRTGAQQTVQVVTAPMQQ